MSEDFYKDGGQSRDGYKSHNEDGSHGGHRYGDGKTGRARFTRSAGSSSYGGYNRGNNSYRSSYNNNEGGYSRDSQRGEGYRPRYNAGGSEGGYQSRNNRFGKSRYSYNNEGNEGGFRPRYNNEGGYQSRSNQGGGYRPRFQQGGNGGSYGGQRRGGYDPHAKYSQKKRLEYKEENYDPTVPVRLNKFLANAGVCSRRDADKYIEAGVVSVNGVVVTELGTKVLRTDEVKFHDNVVKIEKKVYVLLNKPKGYVTTSEDPQNRKTVMDLVAKACPERIYPVGRLDRNTTGVLLLTNDGDLASKLTHPKFLKKKIYHVTTDQNVTAADLRQIAEGITLEDGEIKADAIEYASPTDKKQVGIEIHSGKNRIVRRIFESLGYHVVKLDRVYFAGLTKKNVRRGDWRYLTEKEVQALHMGAFE